MSPVSPRGLSGDFTVSLRGEEPIRMEDQQNTIHGMSLGTALFEDNFLVAVGTPAYQQLAPEVSTWSTTDPTLLGTDHSWKYDRAPMSRAPAFNSDMLTCFHQGAYETLDHGLYRNLQPSADALADPHFASMQCEISQRLQFDTLANQEQYNISTCSSIPMFTAEEAMWSAQCATCNSASQEDTSSGSINMAKENWKVEPDMLRLTECMPNFPAERYSSSVVSDGTCALCDCNSTVHSLSLEGMQQHENFLPLPDASWIYNQAEEGDDAMQFGREHHVLAASTSFDVLMPWATSTAVASFSRGDRNFSSNDRESVFRHAPDQYPPQSLLAADMTQRLGFPLSPLSSAEACKEIKIRDPPLIPWQASTGGVQALVGGATRPGNLPERGKANAKIATTSIEPQSVTARNRRKRISERIRILEKLIPGGTKMDTATMLDEAIEYVKFLQLQAHFLEALDDIGKDDAVPSSTLVTKGTKKKRKVASHGGGGDAVFYDQSCSAAAMPIMRRSVTTSPLILSEVLQQQLFKQRLCLVSLRQCPSRSVLSS